MTAADLVTKAMKITKLSLNALAKKIGHDRRTLQYYRAGKRKLGDEVITKKLERLANGGA